MTNPSDPSEPPADLSGMYPDRLTQVLIRTWGYSHDPEPPDDMHVTLDTRLHLRNPSDDPRLQELTGLDARVRDHVRATPGARNLINNTAALAADLLRDVANKRAHMVKIGIFCVGGRHRSVALAEEIAAVLRADGFGVETWHRDVSKPVLPPTGHTN